MGHKIVLSYDSFDEQMAADAICLEVIADLPVIVIDANWLMSNEG